MSWATREELMRGVSYGPSPNLSPGERPRDARMELLGWSAEKLAEVQAQERDARLGLFCLERFTTGDLCGEPSHARVHVIGTRPYSHEYRKVARS